MIIIISLRIGNLQMLLEIGLLKRKKTKQKKQKQKQNKTKQKPKTKTISKLH